MPKKTYKLLRFDGGINNDADPRDIGDNQLQIAENIDVSEMGLIKGLDGIMDTDGGLPEIVSSWNAVPTGWGVRPFFSGQGQGFSACSTDHGGLLNDSVTYPGKTYYLMESSTCADPEYFTGTTTNSTSGYLMEDTSGTFDTDALVGGTIVNVSDHNDDTGTYSSMAITDNTGVHCIGDVSAPLTGGESNTWTLGDKYIIYPPPNGLWNSGVGPGITGASAVNTGVALEQGVISVPYLRDAVMYYVDGALRIADSKHEGMGSAATTAVPKWRGFIPGKTLMPGTTHGIEVIADQWATQDTHINGAFHTSTPLYADGVEICKNAMMGNVVDATGSDDYGLNLEASTQTADLTDNGECDEDTSNLNWGFFLEFDEHGGGNGTGTWMPTINTRYKFYITTMYDDHKQESLPQLLRMWDTDNVVDSGNTFDGKRVQTEIAFYDSDNATAGENVAINFAPVVKILSAANGNYNFGAATLDSAAADGNARISGYRVYWASNEDGYTSLWQLFDAKWDEGMKVIGLNALSNASGYSPWGDLAGGNGYVGVDLGGALNIWFDPPRFIEYDVINGHSATEVINADTYKTAVVINRRAYIGNISQDGWIHGDRMLKSPVNQFDKFPSINNIDVATHDGDEIILLLEYADRILQFKERIVYIINVSGNVEYLEGEYKFKGISNPAAACRTDYGIAWANNFGCYFYDGEQVTDLLEDQGMRKLTQSSWSDFIGDDNYHRVGFDATKNKIAVKCGSLQPDGKLNHAFIYDMITKSWVKSTDFIDEHTEDSGGNFITDPGTGKLAWVGHSYTHIDVWTEGISPFDITRPCLFITKDIDFGEPAVRKKVYSIYVTYRYTPNPGTGNDSWIRLFAYADGRPTKLYFDYSGRSDNYSNPAGKTYGTLDNVSAGEWVQARLRPLNPSEFKNVKSLAIGVETPQGTPNEDTPNDFQINDITIVFRQKSIK